MKKSILMGVIVFIFTLTAQSQSVSDLFSKSDTKIYWLGIDFSHIKLIGDFTQFSEAGSVGPKTIRDKYFPGWNNLFISEKKKFDIEGMMRKNIEYNLDGITKVNASAATEDMEANSEPNYSEADIQKFIKDYNFEVKDGIGLLFVAESFNKLRESGKYHVIAINLSDNKILLHDVMTGKSGGIGLRNFWAKSYHNVILDIKDHRYRKWKKEYGSK